MLVDWTAKMLGWDEQGKHLDITFRAVPSPADDASRPFTKDDVDPLIKRALTILNSYAHVPIQEA